MGFSGRRGRILASSPVDRLFPYASRDQLFVGRPRVSHLVENYRAWRDFKNLDPFRLKNIAVFGLPRGGTNLVCAHLHYHAQLFTIAERQKSYRLPINHRLFLTYSIFGSFGLQDKKISDIRYLVFNKVNTTSAVESWPPTLVSTGRFKYVFLIRNPLRVVATQHRYATDVDDKPGWLYTSRSFRTTVDMTVALLNMYLETRSVQEDSAALMLYERFCLDPGHELRSLFRILDKELLGSLDQNRGEQFFKNLYCCNKAPVEREGWLRCSNCDRRVRGHGEFNPIEPVSLERALEAPIDSLFSSDDIEYFERAVGPELASYWRNDETHGYENGFPDKAFDAAQTDQGGWPRVVALAGTTDQSGRTRGV